MARKKKNRAPGGVASTAAAPTKSKLTMRRGKEEIEIGEDGRCKCSAATRCPDGRIGSKVRCSIEDLAKIGFSPFIDGAPAKYESLQTETTTPEPEAPTTTPAPEPAREKWFCHVCKEMPEPCILHSPDTGDIPELCPWKEIWIPDWQPYEEKSEKTITG